MTYEPLTPRYLKWATLLVCTVVLALVVFIIPCVFRDTSSGATPDRAAKAFMVVTAIHCLILAGLGWSWRISMQAKQISKALVVCAGIFLILLGLILLDAAFAFMGHSASGMRLVAFSIFGCCAFNAIAGILAILAAIRA